MIVHLLCTGSSFPGAGYGGLSCLNVKETIRGCRLQTLHKAQKVAYDSRPRFGLNIDSRHFSDSYRGIRILLRLIDDFLVYHRGIQKEIQGFIEG